MDGNLDWLYDYLLQFLKSPGWRVPILNFIDQYCHQFEDSNENKLVYTEIHNKFKLLIDGLLENICTTLGISSDQFFKVCESGIKNPSHKRVFEQILACDNFISFKKLMIKRNKEIEVETAKQAEPPKLPGKAQEEAELDLARTLSLQELKESKRLEEKYNEELRLAMKLSEDDFEKQKSQGLSKEEEKKKEEALLELEAREQARLKALKEEEQRIIERKKAEEQQLQKLREEEARIKKQIEEKKLEEERMIQALKEEGMRLVKTLEDRKAEEEAMRLKKIAEEERISKEAEVRRLQADQDMLKQRKMKDEEDAKAMAEAMQQELQRNREKVAAERLKEMHELEKTQARINATEGELLMQKKMIEEKAKQLEEEKTRLAKESLRFEQERLEFEAEKEAKKKKKLDKEREKEDKTKKEEFAKIQKAEEEERRRIAEEEKKIKQLHKENKRLEEMMKEKKRKEEENKSQKKEETKKPKQESDEKRIELGPESSLNVKNLEKELTFDESTEHEVRTVQDIAFKQQEIDVANKVKSSLPPIHGRMAVLTPPNQAIDTVLPSQNEKKNKPETPLERESRLKAQRDMLLAKKRAEREQAFKEYISEGGTDLNLKATPAVSNEELEKRRQILSKIKTYSED